MKQISRRSSQFVILLSLMLLSPGLCVASIPGLELPDKTFAVDKFEPIIPPNVPACRSTDGLNLCGPAAASVLIDSARCEFKKIENCEKLPLEDRASLLDLTRLGLESPDPSNIEKYPREIREFTPGVVALQNACFNTREIARESCAPFDAFVSKLDSGDAQKVAEQQIWTGIKNMYQKYRELQTTCANCALDFATTSAATLSKDFNIKTDSTKIVKAFSQDTFEKFLGQTLLPEACSRGKNLISIFSTKMKLEAWPTKPEERNLKSTLDKLKVILKTRPVMVGRVCLKSNPTPECGGKSDGANHTPAIVGYRKMCKKNDMSQCVDLVKVENSWGCGWNAKNNDGWVMAETFFDHTSYDRKNLLWLADANSSDYDINGKGQE